ncbi:MAG: LysR family transcriptional regulator [Bradyrhizobiaceae bacterium]|nr:LysR family transcriptional regulator [Bradyrhizobiaceae bacterium]
MRIDFLGLQAFISIAERGSFQRGAAHLNLSQTAISHRMKKLEDELGVKLFTRTTREVTLTRAGLDLLPKAKKALRELEGSFDELRQQGIKRQERLAIACLPAFAIYHLPKVLSRFHTLHPKVEVRIFESPSSDVAGQVQSGEAEFGLSVIATSQWDLDIEPIVSVPFVLVCPAHHPLARQRSVRWSELDGTPLIRVSKHAAIRTIIDDALGARNMRLNWIYEVQRVETAVSLAETGVASTIVPKINVDLLDATTIAARPIRNPKLACPFGIVTKRGVPLSPVAETMRDLLVEQMHRRIPSK